MVSDLNINHKLMLDLSFMASKALVKIEIVFSITIDIKVLLKYLWYNSNSESNSTKKNSAESF